ncbi:hypothetical protein DW090_01605 [Olsenella sp. AM05-17]|jgi:hypothetical protein|uniref:hypothetical protein n=1 Tax=unclassified Olsenella TaxID=2638792 RepID=UPI000E47F23C|nr:MULTISPECIES: hypothetical protein [unclassified Olsenella]RHJ96112.1 hypothetical protein DW092_00520 [Olsenella sp. AM05-7]RHK00455.1 hypothetical protein DW090_01605 [Olsenella sp. AM05-17]
MLTAGTFLMYQDASGKYTPEGSSDSTTKWSILMDITEYPDLDAEAKAEDNTTLSCAHHTYEPGLPDDGGSLAFPGFYNDADYERIKKLEGKVLKVAVWFGGTTSADGTSIDPTGAKQMMSTNARVKLRITGGSVGDVRPVELDVFGTTEAVSAA